VDSSALIFRVGLTGGIGAGKSAVCERFRANGVPIIDADEIAREVVAPGGPALADIVLTFGREILRPNGTLRRDKLRTIVFGDPARRKELEAILHPAIESVMQNRVQTIRAPYVVLCIPLLLEARQTHLVDHIVVVDIPEEQQLRRVIARDHLTAAEANAIIRSQCTRAARLAIANDVIINDGDLNALYAQVDRLHRRLLDLARLR
jgi:dephospho-CoA kinase